MELTPQETWTKILASVQRLLPTESYKTWLAPTKVVSLVDDTLVIATSSRFAAEWVQDKYGELLAETGERQVGTRFELHFEYNADDNRIDFPTVKIDNSEDHILGKPRFTLGTINDRYTFDRFVIGSGNNFAAAASNRVADAPATDYNPLFIHGDTGLGKTHLLHAIGNAIAARDPEMRVAYIPSEQFTNEMIDAIRTGQTALFREQYRQIDVLLIDDIHFIANKEGTQEEFFHTFNTLRGFGKQIVITSDRPPDDIPGISTRLVSRFEWGLVTDIQPPDYETRCAILDRKANEENLDIPEDVIGYVASIRQTSVRQLEGAIIRLLAWSSINHGCDITMERAKIALTRKPESAAPEVSPKEIISRVASSWGVESGELISARRHQAVTVPRQVAMYLIKSELNLPYSNIGKLFRRNHSTVIHSVNKIAAEITSDLSLRKRIKQVHQELF